MYLKWKCFYSNWSLQHQNGPLKREYHLFFLRFFSDLVATGSKLSRGTFQVTLFFFTPSGTRWTSSRGQMLCAFLLSSSCFPLSATKVKEEVFSMESSSLGSLGEVTHWEVLPSGKGWQRDLRMVNAASATPLAVEVRRAGSPRSSSSFTQKRKKKTLF